MGNTISSILPSVSQGNTATDNRMKSDAAATKQPDTPITDTVQLSQQADVHETYSASLSAEELENKGYEMLRRLVVSMLEEQGIDFKIAVGAETIDLNEITQEEAQELISEDGYFGVEQTSDRIVDFAIAAAGGDVSKLDAIREGIENGFNEAKDIFGGELPDISYDTYDAVMEKLNQWAESTSV